MNNKVSFAHIAFLLLAFIAFIGCSDDKDFKEVSVTAVNKLYEPDNDKIVNLLPLPNSTLYFGWEKATAQDNGLVYYDVIFDKEDGDFSNPLYVITADNKGIDTGASISHKTMNKIGALAGAASGKQATLKWTVKSSRGLTQTMAKEARKLVITRLDGIETPDGLYVTGEGSEGGTDLSKAQMFKAFEDGSTYEIYTKLTAGKTYYFIDNNVNVSRTFTVEENGKTFKENKGDIEGAKVAKDGVYRIVLDFLSRSVSISELQKVGIFYCEDNKVTDYFNYQGAGIWTLENYNVVFRDKGGWQEDRYKFVFTFDGVDEFWGQSAKNESDSRPNLANETYFYMGPVENDQWIRKFKFANDFFDKDDMDKSFVDVSIILKAEGHYTHKMELRN